MLESEISRQYLLDTKGEKTFSDEDMILAIKERYPDGQSWTSTTSV